MILRFRPKGKRAFSDGPNEKRAYLWCVDPDTNTCFAEYAGGERGAGHGVGDELAFAMKGVSEGKWEYAPLPLPPLPPEEAKPPVSDLRVFADGEYVIVSNGTRSVYVYAPNGVARHRLYVAANDLTPEQLLALGYRELPITDMSI